MDLPDQGKRSWGSGPAPLAQRPIEVSEETMPNLSQGSGIRKGKSFKGPLCPRREQKLERQGVLEGSPIKRVRIESSSETRCVGAAGQPPTAIKSTTTWQVIRADDQSRKLGIRHLNAQGT